MIKVVMVFFFLFPISGHSKPLSLKQRKLQMKFKKPIDEALKQYKAKCGCAVRYNMDWSNLVSFDDGLIAKKIITNSSRYLSSICESGLSKEVCSRVKEIKGKKSKASFRVDGGVIHISVPKDTGPYPNKNQFEESL